MGAYELKDSLGEEEIDEDRFLNENLDVSDAKFASYIAREK